MGGTITAQRPQFLDNDGRPLAGGRVYFYLSGTNIARDTYSDSALENANANPVELDASGRASIFLAPDIDYRIAVEDAAGTQIWVENGVGTPATVPATTIIPLYGAHDAGRDDASYPAGFALQDLVVGSKPIYVSGGFVIGTWRLEGVVTLHALGEVTLGLFNLGTQSATPVVEVAKSVPVGDVQQPVEFRSPEFTFPSLAGEAIYGLKQHSDALARVYAAELRRIR